MAFLEKTRAPRRLRRYHAIMALPQRGLFSTVVLIQRILKAGRPVGEAVKKKGLA